MTNVAVLTGDLIASTDVPRDRVDRTMAALQAIGDAPWLTGLRFARFRGDGWQMLLPQPGLALRLSLRIAAGVIASGTGLSTRLAIGIGTIDHPGTTDLADAAGSAFLRSGRGLDHMPRGQDWVIRGGTGLPDWTTALVALAQWHGTRWTQGQAEVVADWLDPTPRRQEDRATRLGLSRQAWKSRLDGSGIVSWAPALAAFEAWDGSGVTDG